MTNRRQREEIERYRKEIESVIDKREVEVLDELEVVYTELAVEIAEEVQKLEAQIEEAGENYSKQIQVERLEQINKRINDKLQEIDRIQEVGIESYLTDAFKLEYGSVFYQIETEFGINSSFSMLPERVINAIVNTPVDGRRFSERLRGSTHALKTNMNEILVKGFATGKGAYKIAHEIAEVSGSTFGRARNIAITESGRVTGTADQQSQQEATEKGARLEKIWVSTLDGKTRDTHQQLDGQVRGVDEYFEIAGKQALQPHLFGDPAEDCNCRCRAVAVVNGVTPSARRDNLTTEVIDFKSYEEWYKDKEAEYGTEEWNAILRENKYNRRRNRRR